MSLPIGGALDWGEGISRGGVLPYMGYTGMCRPTGYAFCFSDSETGYKNRPFSLEEGMWEIFSLISPYTKSTQLSLTVHRFIPHPSLNSYRSPENYKSENVSSTFLTMRSETSK